MNKTFIAILFLIFIVFLAGVLVDRVGNVGIRRVQSGNPISLEVADPILPGIGTSVFWKSQEELGEGNVEFQYRSDSTVIPIGGAEFSLGEARVYFPCEIDELSGSLIMVREGTHELLDWVLINLLPPGPDCFHSEAPLFPL